MRHEVNPNDSLAIKKVERKKNWRAGIVLTLASTVAAAMVVCEVKEVTEKCEPPSTAAINTVTTLFDRPIKPPGVRVETREAFEKRIEKKERELGITFPTYNEEKLADLEANITLPNEIPFSDYLEATREITDQLGMTVSLYDPSKLKGEVDARTPTPQELETKNAKYQTIYLMRNLITIPTSLSKNIGLKHIVFTAHGKIVGDRNAYGGVAVYNEHTMGIDVNDSSSLTVPHEIEHFVDNATCDDDTADRDPGYEDLNSKDGYANELPIPQKFLSERPKTFADIKAEYKTLRKVQDRAVYDKDETTYCTVEKKLDDLSKDVEVMEPYSYKTVVEDKADIGDQLFDPKDYDIALDPDMPRKRNKFLFLIARLYEKYPTVVEYYSLFGKRPDSTYKCE